MRMFGSEHRHHLMLQLLCYFVTCVFYLQLDFYYVLVFDCSASCGLFRVTLRNVVLFCLFGSFLFFPLPCWHPNRLLYGIGYDPSTLVEVRQDSNMRSYLVQSSHLFWCFWLLKYTCLLNVFVSYQSDIVRIQNAFLWLAQVVFLLKCAIFLHIYYDCLKARPRERPQVTNLQFDSISDAADGLFGNIYIFFFFTYI